MSAGILTKRQTVFLEKFGQNPELSSKFYLTGGTALAEYYLHHRYSEDLDFFCENEIDPLSINVWLRPIQSDIGFDQIDYQQSFYRHLYFLHFPDEILKTEFTFFPFQPIEKGRKELGVMVDSLRDLPVNKLFSIYQRSLARDYIDLYLILKQQSWTVKELVPQAKIKFDWQIDPLHN